jgi:Fic-DOC domain mobile mystery protein B
VTLEPQGDGFTPITYEEAVALVPDWVETRGQLNEVEAEAIATALAGLPTDLKLPTILDVAWLVGLHRSMLGPVWRWAGQYRQNELSIGQDWHRIPSLMQLAVEDAGYWFAHMEADEAALRFHHRLVWVHPFSNGNGRWSRIVADLAVVACGRPAFTWGDGLAVEEQRPLYVAALRRADRENTVDELVAFARARGS